MNWRASKQEKARLEALLADLKGIIRETQISRAKAERARATPKSSPKNKPRSPTNTDELAKKFEGKEGNQGRHGQRRHGKDGMGKDGGKDGMGKDGWQRWHGQRRDGQRR